MTLKFSLCFGIFQFFGLGKCFTVWEFTKKKEVSFIGKPSGLDSNPKSTYDRLINKLLLHISLCFGDFYYFLGTGVLCTFASAQPFSITQTSKFARSPEADPDRVSHNTFMAGSSVALSPATLSDERRSICDTNGIL